MLAGPKPIEEGIVLVAASAAAPLTDSGGSLVKPEEHLDEVERTRRAGLSSWAGPAAVWRLTVAVAVVAVAAAWFAARLEPPNSPLHFRWWLLAPLFYVGEITVVHLRFRQNAHSFSMSEIPLVVALFLASPLDLIVGQLIGNAVALIANRRQSPVKVAFNLSQFTLVAALAALIFRTIIILGDPLGPIGWLGTAAAVWATLLVADSLINLVIRLSGGRLERKQFFEVIQLSLFAGTVNAALGLIVVFLVWSAPQAAWLAAVPPAVVYLGYRAVAMQRIERTRLQAMYEATRELHEVPQIERAVEIAARHAARLLEAEVAEIVLFADDSRQIGYSTRVGPGDASQSMKTVYLGGAKAWESALERGTDLITGEAAADATTFRNTATSEVIVARILGSTAPVGVIVAANRVGDVSHFDGADAKLLSTLASQVAVSLENGRLEDSLAEVTRLKERLEDEMKSKDQFVASVSHELRTPLTAIVGLSGELMANPEAFSAEEHAEIMGLISSQSSDLAHIIEDLLVGARADMGTLTLRPSNIGVDEETRAAMQGQRSAELPTDLNGLTAWADPLRYRQIVRNLLTNAARYGGDRVWIQASEESGRVTVDVCDNGAGVPDEKENIIFEAYERAHNVNGQPGSVGLGLAVARKLARLMDGDLRYLRHDGATIFRLTLPGREAAG